jgi:hypothetical protein
LQTIDQSVREQGGLQARAAFDEQGDNLASRQPLQARREVRPIEALDRQTASAQRRPFGAGRR